MATTVRLVGTAANQVPRNKNLGTLAFLNTAMVPVPASATSTGAPGQIAYDSSNLYVCVAVDTWKRVAIATW